MLENSSNVKKYSFKMAVLYVVSSFYNYLHSWSFDGKTYIIIFTAIFKLENYSVQLGSVTKADVLYAPFKVRSEIVLCQLMKSSFSIHSFVIHNFHCSVHLFLLILRES